MGLRAVSEDDQPDEMTVLHAAMHGSPRDLLIAQRNVCARAIDDDCAPRDLAALTRRLQDIADRLESIDATERENAENVEVADGKFDAKAV